LQCLAWAHVACVCQAMHSNTCHEDKGFFAEKQAKGKELLAVKKKHTI